MGKLYIKKDGSLIPTKLHKESVWKADRVIEKLFNELIEDGLDAVEAKYVIDYSTMDASLNELLDLKC